MASSNHWLLLLPPYQILLDVLTGRQSSQRVAGFAGYDGNTKAILGRVGIEGRLELRGCRSLLELNFDTSPPHGCIGNVNVVLLVPEKLLHLFVIFQN